MYELVNLFKVNFMSINNKLPHSFLIQQSYLYIQNDIINGSLQPGQLVSATHLSKQLKIEKPFIERALCDLVHSGLIIMDNDKMFNVAKITESTIRDVYQTLLQIDEIAISQSIAHGDHAWETEINNTLQELDRALNQPGEALVEVIAKHTHNFHHTLVANCNSPALLQIRSHLYNQFNTFVKLFITCDPNKKQLRQKQKEHKMIAQAALNRDAKAACRLNYYHIIGTLKVVIGAFNKMNSFQPKVETPNLT